MKQRFIAKIDISKKDTDKNWGVWDFKWVAWYTPTDTNQDRAEEKADYLNSMFGWDGRRR